MERNNTTSRVCVIGAGCSGMAVLYYFAKLGDSSPHVTCYERSDTWGGQWNCSSTARYWKSSSVNLSKLIRFKTSVDSVTYSVDKDSFAVVTSDLATGNTNPPEIYSHVIIASGNYTYPNVPKLLAEDVAAQSYKHGASHVIISWRTRPLGYNFPENIEERPMLQKVKGRSVFFIDGTFAEVDTIVLCTGYKMSFPFLEKSLQVLEHQTSVFPSNLYKGVVWLGGGNNKLLYVVMQGEYVPLQMPLADVQAAWSVRYITGVNPINVNEKIQPGLNEDGINVKKYLDTMKDTFFKRTGPVGTVLGCRDYLQDLVDDVGHSFKPTEMAEMLIKTFDDRAEELPEPSVHVSLYRCYRCASTDEMARKLR